MGIRNTRPFLPLTAAQVATLGGHMGVYELADDNGEVLYIGYAGGRSQFGLRGNIEARRQLTDASCFRVEITTAYLTRYQELLMVYVADHGRMPRENSATDVPKLGRLSPS